MHPFSLAESDDSLQAFCRPLMKELSHLIQKHGAGLDLKFAGWVYLELSTAGLDESMFRCWNNPSQSHSTLFRFVLFLTQKFLQRWSPFKLNKPNLFLTEEFQFRHSQTYLKHREWKSCIILLSLHNHTQC